MCRNGVVFVAMALRSRRPVKLVCARRLALAPGALLCPPQPGKATTQRPPRTSARSVLGFEDGGGHGESHLIGPSLQELAQDRWQDAPVAVVTNFNFRVQAGCNREPPRFSLCIRSPDL
jgi:hypothetical protein